MVINVIILNCIYNLINIYQFNQPDILSLILSGIGIFILEIGLILLMNDYYFLGSGIFIISCILSMINSYFEKIPFIFFQNIIIIINGFIGCYIWYYKRKYRDFKYYHFAVIPIVLVVTFAFLFAFFDSYNDILSVSEDYQIERKLLSSLFMSFNIVPFILLAFRFYSGYYVFIILSLINIIIGYFINLPIEYLLNNGVILFTILGIFLKRNKEEITENQLVKIDV